MKKEPKADISGDGKLEPSNWECLLAQNAVSVESLYAQAEAGKWGLERNRFEASLERSAKKRFADGGTTKEKLEEYLGTVHLQDLGLACACAEGIDSAWEHFVATYRGYLRSAAATILRSSAGAPEAVELADSLFAELYGLADGRRGERSLFRYFHGRSTLKTWLRAVLAQRHIDRIRVGRKFEALDDVENRDARQHIQHGPLNQPLDPHRERYIHTFRKALEKALGSLSMQDNDRLSLYYAKGKTLAEIGKELGEHESSVSRNLDRIRREIRNAVEMQLKQGSAESNGSAAQPGLSEAEVALCFEYASEDAPIDLDKIFTKSPAQMPSAGRREP